MLRYVIHDNGGRPYSVAVDTDSRKLSIWEHVREEGADAKDEKEEYYVDSEKHHAGCSCPPSTYKLLRNHSYTYAELWIGRDDRNPSALGNSIILKTLDTGRWIYIGSQIYEFQLELNDSVVDYVSDLGNSDVPYPYIVGRNCTYLMLEQKAFPHTIEKIEDDPYQNYYNADDDYKAHYLNMPITILTERLVHLTWLGSWIEGQNYSFEDSRTIFERFAEQEGMVDATMRGKPSRGTSRKARRHRLRNRSFSLSLD